MSIVKKISILLLVLAIASSCSRKRAPSKGCDCPGGHGMLQEKKTTEPASSIYLKSGSKPS